jgi:hypothetical protein
MVYYLPASEHKMRKWSHCPFAAGKAPSAQQAKTNFRTLRISYTARSSLFCTSATDFMPTGGALNVVV